MLAVALTVYVPLFNNVELLITGFCKLLLKLLGPVHDQALITKESDTDAARTIVESIQTGEFEVMLRTNGIGLILRSMEEDAVALAQAPVPNTI